MAPTLAFIIHICTNVICALYTEWIYYNIVYLYWKIGRLLINKSWLAKSLYQKQSCCSCRIWTMECWCSYDNLHGLVVLPPTANWWIWKPWSPAVITLGSPFNSTVITRSNPWGLSCIVTVPNKKWK